MQEETPIPKKRQKAKQNRRKKQSPSKTRGTMLSNPYQNVQPKTNNPPNPGFNFPGASF